MECFFEFMKSVCLGVRLDEVLTPEQNAQLSRELVTADIRPCTFDVTLEAWLKRLDLWGKLKITHKDPERRQTTTVTRDRMIKHIDNQNLNRLFGKWVTEVLAANKVSLFREYIGNTGKTYKEEFVIEIDVHPDLKKHGAKWYSPVNWFSR